MDIFSFLRKQPTDDQVLDSKPVDDDSFVSELLPGVPAGWRWALTKDERNIELQKFVKTQWVYVTSMRTGDLYRYDHRELRIQAMMNKVDFYSDNPSIDIADDQDGGDRYQGLINDVDTFGHPTLLRDADPELERLLVEEEEIERQASRYDEPPTDL